MEARLHLCLLVWYPRCSPCCGWRCADHWDVHVWRPSIAPLSPSSRNGDTSYVTWDRIVAIDWARNAVKIGPTHEMQPTIITKKSTDLIIRPLTDRGERGESIPTLGGINRAMFEEILTKIRQSIQLERGLHRHRRRQIQRFSNDLKADDEEIKPRAKMTQQQ